MTHKIHVGNIPFICTDYHLHKHFSKFEGYEGCQLLKLKNSKLNKGYGFVTFKTLKDCVRVIKSDIVIEGRKVKCNYYIKKLVPLYHMCRIDVPENYISSQIEKTKKINNYIKMLQNITQTNQNCVS